MAILFFIVLFNKKHCQKNIKVVVLHLGIQKHNPRGERMSLIHNLSPILILPLFGTLYFYYLKILSKIENENMSKGNKPKNEAVIKKVNNTRSYLRKKQSIEEKHKLVHIYLISGVILGIIFILTGILANKGVSVLVGGTTFVLHASIFFYFLGEEKLKWHLPLHVGIAAIGLYFLTSSIMY